MDHQPAPHKWSAGEVLDHLILGQRLNLCYIAELIEMEKAGQRPIKKLTLAEVDVSIGYIPKNLLPALETPFMMLNLIIPSGFRDFMTSHRLVPAQNPSLTTPRRARPADELRNDLFSSFKETETLLEANADLDYGAMMIEHALLGNYNIPGLLRFLALHEQRHQSQINDILAMPRFPGANLNGAGVPDDK
jgi:hypothetical protein